MNWKNVPVLNNENKKNDDVEKLRMDAQKYREHQKQQEAFDKKVEDIRAQWQKDAEAMREIVPDFDFEQAMQNRDFYERIMSGLSIPLAYIAVNYMQAQAPQNKRRTIIQNGQSTANANGSPELNIAGMSDEDFDKYLKKIKNR